MGANSRKTAAEKVSQRAVPVLHKRRQLLQQRVVQYEGEEAAPAALVATTGSQASSSASAAAAAAFQQPNTQDRVLVFSFTFTRASKFQERGCERLRDVKKETFRKIWRHLPQTPSLM